MKDIKASEAGLTPLDDNDNLIVLKTDPESSVWLGADKRIIRSPKDFRFEPQSDITAYELAVLLSDVLPVHSRFSLDEFPECIRRHMKEI